jgi:hypothetical protein
MHSRLSFPLLHRLMGAYDNAIPAVWWGMLPMFAVLPMSGQRKCTEADILRMAAQNSGYLCKFRTKIKTKRIGSQHVDKILRR